MLKKTQDENGMVNGLIDSLTGFWKKRGGCIIFINAKFFSAVVSPLSSLNGWTQFQQRNP
jgi:hypothetical protein